MNLLSVSIIPRKALRSNPRNIPYHNPHFPLIKFNKIVCEYFFYKELQLAEEMAKMNGCLLVPSTCMTWKRKKQRYDVCISVNGKNFYVMKPEEMTVLEKERYLDYANELAG